MAVVVLLRRKIEGGRALSVPKVNTVEGGPAAPDSTWSCLLPVVVKGS